MNAEEAVRAVEILNRHVGGPIPPAYPPDDSWFVWSDADRFTVDELRELGSLGFVQFPGGGFISTQFRRDARTGELTAVGGANKDG